MADGTDPRTETETETDTRADRGMDLGYSALRLIEDQIRLADTKAQLTLASLAVALAVLTTITFGSLQAASAPLTENSFNTVMELLGKQQIVLVYLTCVQIAMLVALATALISALLAVLPRH